MELRRVVVTGLGALTPIGNNIQELWEGLRNGVSGSDWITHFNAEKFKTRDRWYVYLPERDEKLLRR
jgi:3-oxoacyl-[acyl-carrier-protein] synthase II